MITFVKHTLTFLVNEVLLGIDIQIMRPKAVIPRIRKTNFHLDELEGFEDIQEEYPPIFLVEPLDPFLKVSWVR